MLIFSHPVHENAAFCGRPHKFPSSRPRKRLFLWTTPRVSGLPSTKTPSFCGRLQSYTKKSNYHQIVAFLSGYCDSNTGPSGPKPDALANCATPRVPSFGTANIRRKNKSAKFFEKILHFLCLDPWTTLKMTTGHARETSSIRTMLPARSLEIRIQSLPLLYRRNDAQRNDLITHNLKVCVRCIESCDFLCSTCYLSEVNACSIDCRRHSHEDIVILLIVHSCSMFSNVFSICKCSISR